MSAAETPEKFPVPANADNAVLFDVVDTGLAVADVVVADEALDDGEVPDAAGTADEAAGLRALFDCGAFGDVGFAGATGFFGE